MTKLLILENHRKYRESLCNALRIRPAGYDLEVHEKFDEAPEPASVRDVSLALVDRRAQDDEREDDDSGFQYTKDLEATGTRAVLVSAYPQAAGVFDLLRRGAITGVVDKRRVSVHCMILCVEHFLRFRYFPNGIAIFGWIKDRETGGAEGDEDTTAEGYSSRYWSTFEVGLGASVKEDLGEFEVLLRALVSPCATKVDLKINDLQGQSGTLVLKAEVTCVDAPVVETLAVKLGERRTVLSEKLRYDRFVGPLPDGAATQLRWHAKTKNLAAIAYSWVDDIVEEGIEFRRLVSKENTPVVWRRGRDTIDRLFRTSLHAWHKVYQKDPPAELPGPETTLLRHYLGAGGLWYEEQESLDDVVRRIDPPAGLEKGESQWRFSWADGAELPSPARWVKQYGLDVVIDRASPVHGDLHVGNIFILGDDLPRLIDFGRTDMGHVFRDFAALEASIRIALASQLLATQLLDGDQPIDQSQSVLKEAITHAIRSEDVLYAAEHLGDWFDTNAPRPSPMGVVFAECLQLTLTIRRAARDACGAKMREPDAGFAEYLFALTMHLLRYATGVADELPRKEKAGEQTHPFRVWHASYAAARAAQKAASIKVSR